MDDSQLINDGLMGSGQLLVSGQHRQLFCTLA